MLSHDAMVSRLVVPSGASDANAEIPFLTGRRTRVFSLHPPFDPHILILVVARIKVKRAI